jgi:glyoxylase-like metal-dependent hydrolase (beta-lactamase superfamily II)
LPSGTFLPTRAIAALGRLVGRRHFGYAPFVPDMEVDDGFHFSGGHADIRLVATPGHSPGSISITVDGEVAIVGDAIFGVLKRSVFPPFADDVQTMVHSWNTLLHTGCSLFLPGHGKEIVRDRLMKAYAARMPADS